MQPENGFIISTWRGSKTDHELNKLLKHLKKLSELKSNDIRKFIQGSTSKMEIISDENDQKLSKKIN